MRWTLATRSKNRRGMVFDEQNNYSIDNYQRNKKLEEEF